MTAWTKKGLIHEGKAKRVYQTQEPSCVWIEYTDAVTAGNGARREEIPGKGILAGAICADVFRFLTQNGIANHFVEAVSDSDHIARNVEIVPLEVVVRGTAAGSISQRLGIPPGTVFRKPLVEFYYKNDALRDPLVTAGHIRELDLATPEELVLIEQNALHVFQLLHRFFGQAQLTLIDTKLEYGLDALGQLIVADEISPDTCRIWDAAERSSLDKDRFRRQENGVIEAYQEVRRRLQTL